MPIGLPNCSRVFAYSIASSSAFAPIPTASSESAANRSFSGARRVEELLAAVDAAGLLVQHRAVEEAELGDLVLSPAAVREHVARLAPQRLLILGECELHHRPLGRPSTRSAMMLRRISLVPASIVLPRERSCW